MKIVQQYTHIQKIIISTQKLDVIFPFFWYFTLLCSLYVVFFCIRQYQWPSGPSVADL